MIFSKDVVTYTIPNEDSEGIRKNTRLAMIGGVSQIRSGKDRQKSLGHDQLVGQISTYAGAVILTGSPQGYWQARDKANKNPHKGDGGVDIIGLSNVDIKGSMMRYSSDPLHYRLLVRPRERHDGWIYVLAMVPQKRPYKCHLVGWAHDRDLPDAPYNGSIKALHGAYLVEGHELRPIDQLKTLLAK
ncbi:MAG TPA: hypothetical protein EYO37_10450 [Nitrospina sp.]|jgi:hypothetical protein|nr:hypothetical protein [Nitrospina sp.]